MPTSHSLFVRLLCGALLGLAVAADSHAHGDLDDVIAAISRDLAHAPSAELFLLRARLHLEHHDHANALMDCARARLLGGEPAAVERCLGRVLFVDGQADDALAALDRALIRQPQDGETLELRAQVLLALARDEEALAGLDRRESCLPPPQPQFYLDRLALQRALDQPAAVQLAGLDQGRHRLGALVVLEEASLTCELEHGLEHAALARLKRLAASAARPEPWLLQQGDLLLRLGRLQEAQAAYREALVALDRLPPARRQTSSTTTLALRLQAQLAHLANLQPQHGP